MDLDLRLDQIELMNFHKFEHCCVDFDESLTVLVGDNGSGKSSVLEAVAAALDAVLFKLVFRKQRELCRSDARVQSFEMGGMTDSQGQYPVVVSVNGHVGDESVEWERQLNSADGGTVDNLGSSISSLLRATAEGIKNGDTELVLPVLAFYGTGRLWAGGHRSLDARRQTLSRQNGYSGSLDAKASEDQMLTWFFKMTAQDLQRVQSLKPAGESSLFAAVRGAIERCFTLITGSERVSVTYNLDSDDLVVEYVDGAGEIQRMPMGLLSDGYRSTLSMVADIAYRMALLNPALGEKVIERTPGVVLIDEVDLHLHPLRQARILGDLRDIFPRVQFIVTTHAPVVISSVGAEHIRLLGEGDEVLRPSSEVYGSDVGRVLISVMGASERPVEVQKKFDEFYRVLDKGDLVEARELLEGLRRVLGDDDTGVVGAQTALSLEEADAAYAAD